MDDPMSHVRRTYGPYQTTRSIGRASTDNSSVFVAIHEQTQQEVALRVLPITASDVEEVIVRCKAELASIKALNIPNSIEINDYGSTDESIYIATDVMAGGTLQQRMIAFGLGKQEDGVKPRMPSMREVLDMTERICDALDALHGNGLVHGQLEPRSILFDEDGDAYLADIGITRLTKIMYHLEATNSLNVSKYTPPELWNGERPSAATDQYAFACIVYELLVGAAPFNSSSIFDLMKAHAEDVATPPHYKREGLPSELAMVFWQSLAKPVDKRYNSMLAFYAALEEAMGADLGEDTGFFTDVIEV